MSDDSILTSKTEYHNQAGPVKLCTDSPKKSHKNNRIARIEKTIIGLDSWLAGRGWFIDLQSELERARAEIERVEREAIEAIIEQLKRAKSEAAAKDAAEIQAAILKLTAALYGGER